MVVLYILEGEHPNKNELTNPSMNRKETSSAISWVDEVFGIVRFRDDENGKDEL